MDACARTSIDDPLLIIIVDVSNRRDDRLTMDNLLCLPLPTYQEFVSIPKEIGDRSEMLRWALRRYSSETAKHTREFHREWARFDRCAADPERMNKFILKEWIESDDRYAPRLGLGSDHRYGPSPMNLANALDDIIGIRNPDLIRSLRSYDGPLTMSTLLHFPVTKRATTVDVSREVGVKYFNFGTHLLQDETGAHISALELEHHQNSERINQCILGEWLGGKGRPVSWATLVEVLNIIEKGELAKSIEDKYM